MTSPDGVDHSRKSKEPASLPAGVGEAPAPRAVLDYLIYGASLPERALRVTAATLSGVVHQSASLLVPQAFRSGRAYQLFVQQMLDYLAHDVGGVKPRDGAGAPQVEQYVARKTVGSFLEFAGMATMHLSPLAVLAIVSDLAYGSREYLAELANELKRQGVIDEHSTIDSVADLLQAVSRASGETAAAFDLPPLSAEGLRETVEQTRRKLQAADPRRVIPRAELQRIWGEIHEIARRENVGLFQVSAALSMYAAQRVATVGRGTLSGIRVAGNMFDRHILQHYSEGLGTMRRQGFYATVAEASRPYIEAVWHNFSFERNTLTADVLRGKLLGRIWDGMRSWWETREST